MLEFTGDLVLLTVNVSAEETSSLAPPVEAIDRL